MWSTVGDVPAIGDVNINHIVTLMHKRDATVPVPQPQATATTPVSIPGDTSGDKLNLRWK